MKDNILRLNPIFALFSPTNALILLVYFGLCALAIFGDVKIDIAMLLLAIIGVCIMYYRWTKKIYLDRNKMEFIYYHRISRGRGSVRVKTLYSISNIRDLKFAQNPIEKLFGAGHFSFTCNSDCDCDKDHYYDIKPKNSFTFYGLSNFKNTKKEICDILGVNEAE